MPIEVLRHFSVPIYSVLLPDFDAHREPLLLFLKGLRDGGQPDMRLTNRNSWHSNVDLHTLAHPEVQWIARNIVEVSRAALAGHYAGFRETEPRIADCWSVIGGRGAWHTPHHHHPRPWSGVLYVAAEHCVSKTDPSDRAGKIEFFNPMSVAPAFFVPPSIAYDPRDGLLLLFPGALQHMVHPNETDGERVIVSFNVEIVRSAKKEPS